MSLWSLAVSTSSPWRLIAGCGQNSPLEKGRRSAVAQSFQRWFGNLPDVGKCWYPPQIAPAHKPQLNSALACRDPPTRRATSRLRR